MIKRAFLLGLIMAVLSLSGTAPAAPVGPTPTVAVLLDGSRSMEGFFNTREIFTLHKQIADANQGGDLTGRDTVFISNLPEGATVPTENSQPYREDGWSHDALGGKTYIDDAFTNHSGDADIVWLVTDNVQNPKLGDQDQENGDITKFYAQLKEDRVKRVWVFAPSRRFEGALYRKDDTVLKNDYKDNRGLVVYAILLNDEKEAFFAKSVRNFKAVESGVRVKPPWGFGSVTPEIVPNPDAPPQERLRVEGGRLVSSGVFNEGAPIDGSFLVRFRSNLDNVVIDKPSVKATIVQDFRLSPDFYPGQQKITATPAVISEPLGPGQTSKQVVVEVKFPEGLSLKAPWSKQGNWGEWGPLARAALKRGQDDFKGKIRVYLSVKQASQFSVARDLLISRSTSDQTIFTDPEAPPALHQKIFGLDLIFTKLSGIDGDRSTILTDKYDIDFKVLYPSWPAIVLIALFILLAALAVAVWALLAGSPLYHLSRTGKNFYFQRAQTDQVDSGASGPSVSKYRAGPRTPTGDQPLRLPYFKKVPVLLETEPGAWLRRVPVLGITAAAANGYSINDRRVIRLDETGSDFTITDHAVSTGTPKGGAKPAAESRSHRTPESIYKK